MDGMPTLQRPQRLVSLDAYRGLIMLFMASGGLGVAQVAKHYPDSRLWQWIAFHTSHAAWVGGGAWDMIQPSFMFMVGMAVPFSLARRTAEGQTAAGRLLHAAWRAAVLVALGVFLASNGKKQPDYIFVNVLAQIGLGYVFLVALAGRGWKVQTATIATIAVACWAAFARHPLPGPDVDLAALGVTPELAREAVLPGFFAHWSMNTNLAADADRWFLNLFPREAPFVFNAGGYQTLNFIPSLITMILGLMAGERLRAADAPPEKLRWLLAAGAACLAAGLAAGATCCPIVKRIWTPSWAVFSGGVSLWLVAAFYWAIDVKGWRSWAWPLVVVGMNSIAIYLAHQLLAGWIRATAKTWLGAAVSAGPFGVVWQNLIVLTVLWLWCWWLYRRGIFLRI
jgi:heparan-alpha-glucosaminide N-acetyltransferase